jgi:DNA processing protein
MTKITRLTKSENDFLDHFPEEIAVFARGTLPKERIFSVAIVGTRKPTKYGEETAYSIAYELAKQGIIVISGLAIGIDAAAHRGALDGARHGVKSAFSPEPPFSVSNADFTPTIAVLATSVDNITPAQNRSLGERILNEGGAIISEYAEDVEFKPWYLLERNRIVSGLADAVIIVEAAARSGTLATARHAMKQGRPVFVVPGRLTDKMSAGCHILLEQYPEIRLFTSVPNMLASLSDSSRAVVAKKPRKHTTAQDLIKAGMSSTEITEKLGISASELAIIQTELELFG